MPPILEAVKVYATQGEICDALREVFGTYVPGSARAGSDIEVRFFSRSTSLASEDSGSLRAALAASPSRGVQRSSRRSFLREADASAWVPPPAMPCRVGWSGSRGVT